MSNETRQSETMTAAEQAVMVSACPHPEAIGMRWGDPISQERQAELQGYLDRWKEETDHGECRGPFENQGEVVTVQIGGADVKLLSFDDALKCWLTGADVSWLVKQSPVNGVGWTLTRHLEGTDLSGAHLEGADLIGAHLEHAELDSAHLQRADLNFAHLEG